LGTSWSAAIQWSILSELRKADPLSQRVRLSMREAELAKNEQAQKLGRAPSAPEVAQHLGVEVGKHRAPGAIRAGAGGFCQGPAGVRAGARPRDPRSGSDHSATDPASAAEVRARLVRPIEALNEQERAVTTLYFYEGLTLREIGAPLTLPRGVSPRASGWPRCVSAGRSPRTPVSPRGPSPSFGILEAWTPLC
jgi:RNA polymerase sigma factor FliA